MKGLTSLLSTNNTGYGVPDNNMEYLYQSLAEIRKIFLAKKPGAEEKALSLIKKLHNPLNKYLSTDYRSALWGKEGSIESKMSLLNYCSFYGHKKVVEFYCTAILKENDSKSHFNQPDEFGLTSMAYAVAGNQPVVFKLLLDQPDINLEMVITEERWVSDLIFQAGGNILHIAAQLNNLDTFLILAKKLPDSLNTSNSIGQTPLQIVFENFFYVLNALPAISNTTPLPEQKQTREYILIKELLELGGDPNVRISGKPSLLEIAVEKNLTALVFLFAQFSVKIPANSKIPEFFRKLAEIFVSKLNPDRDKSYLMYADEKSDSSTSLEMKLTQLIEEEKLSSKNAYVFIRSEQDFSCIYVKNGVSQTTEKIVLKPSSQFDQLESLISHVDDRSQKSGYVLLTPESIQIIVLNTSYTNPDTIAKNFSSLEYKFNHERIYQEALLPLSPSSFDDPEMISNEQLEKFDKEKFRKEVYEALSESCMNALKVKGKLLDLGLMTYLFQKMIIQSKPSLSQPDFSKTPVVLIIGRTNAGKSTLVCHLLDIPLKETINKKRQQCVEVDSKYQGGRAHPGIGLGIDPATVIPEIYSLQDESSKQPIVFCDSPGTLDVRGPEADIINEMGLRTLTQRTGGIAAIVLVFDVRRLDRDQINEFLLGMPEELGSLLVNPMRALQNGSLLFTANKVPFKPDDKGKYKEISTDIKAQYKKDLEKWRQEYCPSFIRDVMRSSPLSQNKQIEIESLMAEIQGMNKEAVVTNQMLDYLLEDFDRNFFVPNVYDSESRALFLQRLLESKPLKTDEVKFFKNHGKFKYFLMSLMQHAQKKAERRSTLFLKKINTSKERIEYIEHAIREQADYGLSLRNELAIKINKIRENMLRVEEIEIGFELKVIDSNDSESSIEEWKKSKPTNPFNDRILLVFLSTDFNAQVYLRKGMGSGVDSSIIYQKEFKFPDLKSMAGEDKEAINQDMLRMQIYYAKLFEGLCPGFKVMKTYQGNIELATWDPTIIRSFWSFPFEILYSGVCCEADLLGVSPAEITWNAAPIEGSFGGEENSETRLQSDEKENIHGMGEIPPFFPRWWGTESRPNVKFYVPSNKHPSVNQLIVTKLRHLACLENENKTLLQEYVGLLTKLKKVTNSVENSSTGLKQELEQEKQKEEGLRKELAAWDEANLLPYLPLYQLTGYVVRKGYHHPSDETDKARIEKTQAFVVEQDLERAFFSLFTPPMAPQQCEENQSSSSSGLSSAFGPASTSSSSSSSSSSSNSESFPRNTSLSGPSFQQIQYTHNTPITKEAFEKSLADFQTTFETQDKFLDQYLEQNPFDRQIAITCAQQLKEQYLRLKNDLEHLKEAPQEIKALDYKAFEQKLIVAAANLEKIEVSYAQIKPLPGKNTSLSVAALSQAPGVRSPIHGSALSSLTSGIAATHHSSSSSSSSNTTTTRTYG